MQKVIKKLLLIFSMGLFLFGCSKQDTEDAHPVLAQADNIHPSESTVKIPKNLDVVEIAKCTAAAMKAGQGIELYRPWADELTRRYSKIYPEKSKSEIDNYTTERILDKRRYLESLGISTPVGFYKFYKQNCEM